MEGEHIIRTKKKPSYPIGPDFREYLARYARECTIPVTYERLLNYTVAAPLEDELGNDTLWETVGYPPEEMQHLSRDLAQIYTILKAESPLGMSHLYADRIDYCTFGNSNPFRIRIVNALNENHDYYYVKRADASRAYGIELEHLLSPNRMFFLTHGNTLVEEHVVGVPGDMFIRKWLTSSELPPIRLAKELVKFNERCFVRLLGDMRAYNFVLQVTPDFEGMQVRIRAMDFDQQSYSGRKNFYLPQFFVENHALVRYCQEHLTITTAEQYQREEQALVYRRARSESVRRRLRKLLECMERDQISPPGKVSHLAESLAEHYTTDTFRTCDRMGQLIRASLEHISNTIENPMNSTNSMRYYFPT